MSYVSIGRLHLSPWVFINKVCGHVGVPYLKKRIRLFFHVTRTNVPFLDPSCKFVEDQGDTFVTRNMKKTKISLPWFTDMATVTSH